MAQFVVRNLEDDVHEKLREMARSSGRSLEETVRDILRASTLSQKPRGEQEGLGTQISKRFAKVGLDSDFEIEEVRGFQMRIPDFSGPEYDPPDDKK